MLGSDELDRIERAQDAYVRGTFFGEDDVLEGALGELALCELEGTLSPLLLLQYGKLLHARSHARGPEEPRERAIFAHALTGLRQAGDLRGEGEALFWQGLCSQLFDEDLDTAEPLLQSSYKVAGELGDDLTRSYAARHLGFVAASRGQYNDARALLEESLHVRQALGNFPAGEAAALLALGELELEAGNKSRAKELLDLADTIASRIGASRVRHWIAEARAGFS